jgi:hypothetical protein
MSDEEELIEEARRSVEETEQLRKEAESLPEKHDPQTSSGDADSVTEDESRS